MTVPDIFVSCVCQYFTSDNITHQLIKENLYKPQYLHFQVPTAYHLITRNM